MKKVVAFVLLLILFCSSLTAQATNLDFGELFNSVYNSSSSAMPRSFHMPEEFSIVYEYVEEGKFKEVLMEKDKNDNYHYKDHEDEFLFVKEGRGYRIAIATMNGFVYKNKDKYDFDYIKELTSKFWKCAEPLEDYQMGTTTEEGSGNICGRKTNKFKVELGLGYNLNGLNVSMSDATFYEFDAETGICMASSKKDNISYLGMNLSDGDNSGFECISFETDRIVLPKVDS